MRATASVALLVVLLAGVLAAQRAQAQDAPGVLTALLTEVRGLRQAMEQMAAAGPRVQLALGRLQLQEQRINTLVRRLETVRDALSAAQRELGNHQGALAQFEASMKDGSGPQPEREQMSHMIENFRREVARGSAEVQRLTAEESSLASDIASEQGRWTDLNQRLEELERTLGGR
jgi:chromosome segregation ATPase